MCEGYGGKVDSHARNSVQIVCTSRLYLKPVLNWANVSSRT